MSEINILKFYNQVKQEISKVSWPSRQELLYSTMLVLIVVTVFSIVSIGVDYSINKIVQFLLHINK